MTPAEWVALAIELYAAVGAVFGVAFAAKGAGRIDPAAKTAGLGFRLTILAGAAVLWPVLAIRWVRV